MDAMFLILIFCNFLIFRCASGFCGLAEFRSWRLLSPGTTGMM
jgi:hypothetical protein